MNYLKISIVLFLLLSNEKITASLYTISGYISDKMNDEPLIGANIYIEGTSQGSSTNEKGFYKITNVKEGRYKIKVTYIGYKTLSDTIKVNSASKLFDKNSFTKNYKLNYTTIEGNEVIVTAQAKGQMNAINKQLNSKSLVNIISSDRIQELPNANAAETVARVPGVSIRREGGEGNKIIIRGLSPKYNNITVNGVKLASTDNNNRSTDLSMISQYMLDGIEIIKAGTPDKDADVLGGTVDFKLKKAQPGLNGNFISQGMHNGLKDSYNDKKLVFDLSRRFFNDQFGVLIQYDFENRNRSSHEVGTTYELYAEQLELENALYLTSLNLDDWIRLNKRDNRLEVFDYKLPNGNISYSNLNSNIEKDITRYNIRYALPRNFRFMNSSQGTNLISIITESWKYEQTFRSNFHLEAFYSFSQSKSNEDFYDFFFEEPVAYETATFDQSIKAVQKIAKNDLSNTSFRAYDFNTNMSIEKEKAKGFNFKYDFRLSNLISGSMKFGYKSREKERIYDRQNEFLMTTSGYGRDSLITLLNIAHLVSNPSKFPFLGLIDSDYKNNKFFNGKYSFGAVADLDLMMKIYKFYLENWDINAVQDKYGSSLIVADTEVVHHVHQTNSQIYDYSGKERYEASYIMGDINFGSKFNLITGWRMEKNETSYSSYSSLDHALPHWIFVGEPETYDRENSYFFPALFLTYKPNPWLNIRYAKTRTLTRPDYSSLIPLNRASGQYRTIDWRNKFLKPGISENNDISISFHQDKLGLVTLGYFKKDIQDLIYSSGSRIILPKDTLRLDISSNYEYYKILDYSLNNPNKVKLKGWEFDYQTRFWYLPSFLNGLVFNANYTIANSKVQYPRTVIEGYFDFELFEYIENNIDGTYIEKLIDQPDEIINISIGYDYKGFSSRLSMLYNDGVFISTNFWPELRETTDPYTRWDLSMKQSLPTEGLEIFLNVSNMTEANDVNRYNGYNSFGNNLKSEQHYGRTIDLGFRYSF